jgi:hypothetical protein
MKSSAVVLIQRTSYAWRVASPIPGSVNQLGGAASNPAWPSTERRVELEIQGDPKNGYHLVMSPEGCFTADSWHATLEDALADALGLFGVPIDGWTT